MTERVEPNDLVVGYEVRWEPNRPAGVLISDDEGRAVLAQRAHPDDPNQDCVVLQWDGAVLAQMAAPNDEALHLH